MHRSLAAIGLSLALCRGQQGALPAFGTTVVIAGGMTGKIYHIPFDSTRLPKFENLEPVGTIYTRSLWVPSREFSEGFPGITSRIEWFALDFTGRIYIQTPGTYTFSLCSDDGSKLYIDTKTVIDNDGVHGEVCLQGGMKLSGGIHGIRISYFQGPRFHLSLMLGVAGPKDKRFRLFNTDEFQPPSDPAEWKYGSPATLQPPPDPDAGRTRLRDVIPRPAPVVSLSVQVLAQNQPVLDLKPSDFVVRDEGEPQRISDFTFNTDPLDAMLLVDNGPGMSPFHERLKALAPYAIAGLNSGDRIGIIQFADQQLLTLGLAAVPALIETSIRKIPPHPQLLTEDKDLSAPVALAALYLQDHARPQSTRAVIILTDNRGRPGGVSDRATRVALWNANVILCGLFAKREPAAEAGVRQFIDATGGRALDMEPGNLPIEDVLADLHKRYRLTWRAPGGPPQTIRKVAVELTPEAKLRLPTAKILAPAAYVVPSPATH